MELFHYISDVKQFIAEAKGKGLSIGFVPTMGALHQGHISLVKHSLMQTDITIVSIFVNPTQFNDANDLKNYPRNFEQDKEMLLDAGCHAIFCPGEQEMYPEPDTRVFDFDGLDNLMEGLHRPGHFNGVAQIVSKLFDVVQADKAFFGLKDFQQVSIIKKLTQILNLDIEIVPCPIIREADGLAMSSRNGLLLSEHRKNAHIIYQVLNQAKSDYDKYSLVDLKEIVTTQINQSGLFTVEYFELVDFNSLKTINDKVDNAKIIGCIAVWAGKIRLIDNVIFNF